MRQTTAVVHRILGIIVGFFIVIIGLTGSILVFDKEINPVLHFYTHQVIPQGERISLQQVALRINQQYPNSKLDWLTIPAQTSEPYHALIKSLDKSKSDIYINPYSGEILGIYPRDRPWMKIINQLHTHLLAGQFGGFVVGLCGVILLMLTVTGSILWNGWKKLSLGFKIRWRAKQHILNYDLHKVGGIFTALFLGLIATSGSLMVFEQPMKNLAYWINHQSRMERPVSTLEINTQPLSLDKFLEIATNSFPQGQPTIIYPPKDEKSVVQVRFKLPHEISHEGKSFVFIDQYSGDVLRAENFFQTPGIEQLKAWIDALHTGSYGGLGMMVIYMVVGILSTALSMTGFVMWWGRNLKFKRRGTQSFN
jgi:uncharacterized iron-regulated membrane protein